MRNIVLIGFMGSGKSMVAKALQTKLKCSCVSTDDLIEKKESRSIADIFKDSGEAYFRKLEQQVIEELSHQQGLIIDCGGGSVLNPKNLQLLKKNGTVFYLAAPAEVLYQRLKSQRNRPLLNVADPQAKIKELLNQRIPLYQQADHTVDASDPSIEKPVEEIMKRIQR